MNSGSRPFPVDLGMRPMPSPGWHLQTQTQDPCQCQFRTHGLRLQGTFLDIGSRPTHTCLDTKPACLRTPATRPPLNHTTWPDQNLCTGCLVKGVPWQSQSVNIGISPCFFKAHIPEHCHRLMSNQGNMIAPKQQNKTQVVHSKQMEIYNSLTKNWKY